MVIICEESSVYKGCKSGKRNHRRRERGRERASWKGRRARRRRARLAFEVLPKNIPHENKTNKSRASDVYVMGNEIGCWYDDLFLASRHTPILAVANVRQHRHYRQLPIRSTTCARTHAHCVKQVAIRASRPRLGPPCRKEKPGAPQGKISNLLLSVKGKVSRAKRPAEWRECGNVEVDEPRTRRRRKRRSLASAPNLR